MEAVQNYKDSEDYPNDAIARLETSHAYDDALEVYLKCLKYVEEIEGNEELMKGLTLKRKIEIV